MPSLGCVCSILLGDQIQKHLKKRRWSKYVFFFPIKGYSFYINLGFTSLLNTQKTIQKSDSITKYMQVEEKLESGQVKTAARRN